MSYVRTPICFANMFCPDSNRRPLSEIPSEKFVDLRNHSLYTPAADLLAREWSGRPEFDPLNPVNILVAMLVLCNDDRDVSSILKILLTSKKCSNSEALDLFYQVWTLQI